MVCNPWHTLHKSKWQPQTDGQLFYGVSISISSGNMSGLIGQAAYGDVDMCMSGIFMDVVSEI